MPPASKTGTATKDRRKSDKGADKAIKLSSSPGVVTLKVSPHRLRALLDDKEPASSGKEDTPSKDAKDSPATSATVPAAPASNPENASDSTPNTPQAGTPAPQPMGPPTDGQGPKKKGVKRNAAAMNGNGEAAPKVRGKPGPKKKQRL
jgi:hypothetical protein